MSRILHKAYGLSISSELVLPELPLLSPTEDLDQFDIEIRLGHIASPEELGPLRQVGPFVWAGSGILWLYVPEIATFLVCEGREILIEPAAGVDEASIRLFLLGSAIGALLMQRGLLVLHGNAIRVGDQCLVCVGHSGAGKSTLAAGFARRGYPPLADDVVPIDAQGRALPGIPRIKLWRDSAEHLQIDTSLLSAVRPSLEKFSLPQQTVCDQALPVVGLYVLSTWKEAHLQLDPIRGVRRFEALREHYYRPRFVAGLGLQAQHFSRFANVARQARVSSLTRPSSPFDVDSLVDVLLADMNKGAP